MALDLDFCASLESNGTTLNVTDITNPYSSSNTGGWGTPNPAIADADTATLTISRLTDLATNTYTSPVEITASYPTLPNITNTPYGVTGAAMGFGSGATYPDGYYKIIYTITGNSGGLTTATVTKYAVLSYDIDSCYQELADEVAVCSCNCIELEKKLNNMAYFQRQLTAAKKCGNLAGIIKNIEILTDLCADTNCC